MSHIDSFLEEIDNLDSLDNPSFVIISNSKRILYELDDIKQNIKTVDISEDFKSVKIELDNESETCYIEINVNNDDILIWIEYNDIGYTRYNSVEDIPFDSIISYIKGEL
jgi:6-phosphogluconolactonase (cycloisomerase 2 family)